MWVKDKKEIQKLFQKWSGSSGQVWEYVCGHGTLLVRFFRPNQKLSLFLQCKDCRTIQFQSMGWQNAIPQLYQKANPQQNDEDFKYEIKDNKAFYVTCWGVYLIESEKPVHIDWPPESRKISENRLLI